jgi:hypothetical protein
MFCCCPWFHFPQAILNWESCHKKQGHLPPASSIDWLGCHRGRPGRSCLGTIPVPGDVGPLWHHNQAFSDWSECEALPQRPLSLHTPATLVPVTGKFLWSEDGYLLQFPSSKFRVSTEMTFLTCSIILPILEAAFWRIGSASTGDTKTPQALCSAISQEKSNNIEWENFSPTNTSPIIRCLFPCVDAKYSTLETRGLNFQASVFLTSSKQSSSLRRWQEHQSDQCIHFMSTKKLIHFDPRIIEEHTVYSMNA